MGQHVPRSGGQEVTRSARIRSAKKKFLFSDNSYLISGSQLIECGDRKGINSLEDLRDKKVGTGVGSNYTKTLEDFNSKKDVDLLKPWMQGRLIDERKRSRHTLTMVEIGASQTTLPGQYGVCLIESQKWALAKLTKRPARAAKLKVVQKSM